MHGDGLVLLRTIRLVGKRKQKQSRTIGRSMPAFFRFSFSSLWWSSSALRCNASRSSFLSISLMFALNTFCAAIVSSLVACSRARRRLTRSSSLSPKSRMGSPRRRRRLMTSLDEISPAWPSFSAWVALVSSLETIRGAADTLEATLSVEATASSSASEEEVDPSAAAWGTAATDTGAAAAFFACSTPHPHRVCQSAPRQWRTSFCCSCSRCSCRYFASRIDSISDRLTYLRSPASSLTALRLASISAWCVSGVRQCARELQSRLGGLAYLDECECVHGSNALKCKMYRAMMKRRRRRRRKKKEKKTMR